MKIFALKDFSLNLITRKTTLVGLDSSSLGVAVSFRFVSFRLFGIKIKKGL